MNKTVQSAHSRKDDQGQIRTLCDCPLHGLPASNCPFATCTEPTYGMRQHQEFKSGDSAIRQHLFCRLSEANSLDCLRYKVRLEIPGSHFMKTSVLGALVHLAHTHCRRASNSTLKPILRLCLRPLAATERVRISDVSTFC